MGSNSKPTKRTATDSVGTSMGRQPVAAKAKASGASTAKRGGARPGAGRPIGSGQFKEPTQPLRVPVSSVPLLQQYLTTLQYAPQQASALLKAPRSNHAIPLYSSKIAAGVPSSAEDHIDDTLDLNQYLIERPDSTYMLKVEGESMLDIGILPDDILIVDRGIEASHNKIVIAAIDGQLTVKRLYKRGGVIKLLAENKDYPNIELNDASELIVWGVVVGSFRKFQSV